MRSNCLMEALKAKVTNPKQNKIYRRGSWLCVFRRQWPHFYWYHRPQNKYYAFYQKDALTWIQGLWYEGDIVEYRLEEAD